MAGAGDADVGPYFGGHRVREHAHCLYTMRFLLGVAEAGFIPGVLLYLTYWFPASRRGRITALFLTAIPVASILGGPLSGWILSVVSGAHGYSGWQWLF